MKQGFIKAQKDNSKKLNPKLAVREVIYISENVGKTGLNTEGFVSNLFTKQLDLEILPPTPPLHLSDVIQPSLQRV